MRAPAQGAGGGLSRGRAGAAAPPLPAPRAVPIPPLRAEPSRAEPAPSGHHAHGVSAGGHRAHGAAGDGAGVGTGSAGSTGPPWKGGARDTGTLGQDEGGRTRILEARGPRCNRGGTPGAPVPQGHRGRLAPGPGGVGGRGGAGIPVPRDTRGWGVPGPWSRRGCGSPLRPREDLGVGLGSGDPRIRQKGG